MTFTHHLPYQAILKLEEEEDEAANLTQYSVRSVIFFWSVSPYLTLDVGAPKSTSSC